MTLGLDPAITIGQTTLAALTRRRVTATRLNATVVGYAQKHPVAVLLRHGDTVLAFAPDGTALTKAQVDALCAGAGQSMKGPD